MSNNCDNEECTCECDENCEVYKNEKLLIKKMICDDDKIEEFKRIDKEYINDNNNEFINKIHNYYDN